jgi:hypothetical protein
LKGGETRSLACCQAKGDKDKGKEKIQIKTQIFDSGFQNISFAGNNNAMNFDVKNRTDGSDVMRERDERGNTISNAFISK